MPDQNNRLEPDPDPRQSQMEGLLWLILAGLSVAVIAVVMIRYWDKIKLSFIHEEVENYDTDIIQDNYHDMTLPNGQSWDLSYETGVIHSFTGVVRYISVINEPAFAILSFDILVTSEDFANPDLVQTSVTNHHFTWSSPHLSDPQGEIHLLHTVPINEEVNDQLKSIQEGDTVSISGYEIYRIEGFDNNGNYIGFWEDAGCNTTLVTSVNIQTPQ
jgi:hypothetical protein